MIWENILEMFARMRPRSSKQPTERRNSSNGDVFISFIAGGASLKIASDMQLKREKYID